MAVADGVPAVAGDGEAATAGEIPVAAGSDDAMSNDTTGDVGGTGAVRADLHPLPPPDCGSGAQVTLLE